MRTSEQTNEIVAALFTVQTTMKAAIKDSKNPAFKSKYADLASVWEACRDPLKANKVLVSQDVTGDAGGVAVITRLSHVASAQWVEFGPLYLPLTKQDSQAVGSAVSYGRRYALSAALGILAEDDDGNAATAGAKAEDRPAATSTNGNGHAPKPASPARITTKQRDELRAEAKGNQWPKDKYYELLGKHGFKADDDITADIFPTIFQCVHQGTMTIPPPAHLLPDDPPF